MEDTSTEWTLEEYLDSLNNAGSTTPCDTGATADIKPEIPPWFDENKFKRGQQYFKENIFSMFISKLCGLMTVMAIPDSLQILVMTGKSSKPLSAYRRYTSTVLHTTMWYDVDLNKESSSWESLTMIRKRHLQASQSACKHGLGQISQKQMVLTQFGFMGYALIRPGMLGIYNQSKEDQEGFVHVWRTIGYILGIDDKFNLCRESLEETKAACHLVMETQLKVNLIKHDPLYESMVRAFIDGMVCLNPFNNYGTFMFLTKRLLGIKNYEYSERDVFDNEDTTTTMNNNNNNTTQKTATFRMCEQYRQLSCYAKVVLVVMVHLFEKLLQYNVVRTFCNFHMHSALFFIKYFPFIAMFKFGLKYCYVNFTLENSQGKLYK